jgi:hypothetical protein
MALMDPGIPCAQLGELIRRSAKYSYVALKCGFKTNGT